MKRSNGKDSRRTTPRSQAAGRDKRNGCLWDCTASLTDGSAYTELFCVGTYALARRLCAFKRHEFQAVLFLPPPRPDKARRHTDENERMLLMAVGLREPHKRDRLRYSRILICRAGTGRATAWMDELLRRRGPNLFMQNRVFGACLPARRSPTYEEFCAAVGQAAPIGLSPQPVSRY